MRTPAKTGYSITHTVEACSATRDGGYILRLVGPTGTARSSSAFEPGQRVRVSGGIVVRA